MLQPADSRFWQVALQTGLVDEDRLKTCWNEIPREKRTPDAIDRRLARRVVESGLLTRWQAQQLLAGVRPQAFVYDKYVIEDMIGQGGMGRVYRARDRSLRRPVAIKMLSRDRMSNPRALARFQREAWVGAQLQHENLVRIYDAGEHGGQHFLVMEYIEGKTLGQLLGDRGPLPASLAARIARQVALGLEHARQKKLVHRDVNPMNILLDRDGTAKLTDLGLAIDLGDEGEAVTRDGATVGTFDYISPEQARHSRSIDIRSDIYSLGCSLYQMLTARVPFPQPSLPEKLYAHQMLDPEPIASLVNGVPEGLQAILGRMMAKRPEDRYDTPADVARALEPYQCGAVALEEIESSPEVAILIDEASTPSSARGIAPEMAPTVVGAEAPIAVGETPITGTPPVPTQAVEVTTSVSPGDIPIFPQIDVGPEPALSESLSAARRTDSRVIPPQPRRKTWLAIPIVLLLAVWLVRFLTPKGVPSEPLQAQPTDSGPEAPGPAPDLAVRWLDEEGQPEQAVPSLREAVRLAVNKNAEVLLRPAEPLTLAAHEALSVSGSLTLRGPAGKHPLIRIVRGRSRPAFEVQLGGSLKLVGLTFEIAGEGDGALPPALIRSLGDVELDHCKLRVTGEDRSIIAIQGSGRRTTVANSWFAGFDAPVVVEAVRGAQIAVENCLVTRDRSTVEPPRTGWAVAVTRVTPSGRSPRTMRIRHCTVVGLGIVGLRRFSPEDPARLTVESNVVQGPAVMMWDSESPFPRGLDWQGRDNLFDLRSPDHWVVLGPGSSATESAPSGFEAWCRAVRVEEGSTARSAPFVGSAGVAPEDRGPADFVLVGQKVAYGIRPSDVGP